MAPPLRAVIAIAVTSAAAASLGSCSASLPRLTLITYNVENLFDATADGGEYPEFRDERRWDEAAYHRKLAAVADALHAAAPGGADLLLLQEVEGARVVGDLHRRHLQGMGYRHLVVAPTPNVQAPPPATTIAVLSRLPVRRAGLLQVDPAADPAAAPRSAGAAHATPLARAPPLRPLLELELPLADGETLFLFTAHWKSKRGGEGATAGYRRAAAEVLRRRLADLLRDDPAVDVVIAGDLNETGGWVDGGGAPASGPTPGGIRVHGSAGMLLSPAAANPIRLLSAWRDGRTSPAVAGSYHFRGTWQPIDHVLFTSGLADPRGVSYEGGLTVATDGLLTAAGTPRGTRAGGASDHLPVVVELRRGALAEPTAVR